MLRRMACYLILSLSMTAQTTRPAPIPTEKFQISGTVVDSLTGQPLSNTRVAIAAISQRADFTTVVTSDDGRFVFHDLVPNKYTLTAQRRGYITGSFNQHEQFASSIAVGPGLNSSNLVFRLAAESTISGTVTDDQGDEVRDAEVMLFQNTVASGSRSIWQRARAQTDENGFYRFSHLPAGRYYIAVSAEPWYAEHFTPRTAISFSVSQGGSVGTSFGSIGGVVGNASASAPVEEQRSPLDVSFPLTFYSGVTDASQATAIVLERGEKASIDVVLTAVRALHFRLNTENPQQQPGPAEQQPGVSIHLEQTLFNGVPVPIRTQYATTEPGVVEVVGVVPGHYHLKINTWNKGQMQALQERDIEVSGSGELDASNSIAAISLTAEVILAAPSARDQISVLLHNKKSGKIILEPMNEKGEAEFKQGVLPGTYEVSLRSSKQIFIKNLSASGAKVTGRTLEIKGRGPVKLSITAVEGEGQIQGVVFRDGKETAGAMVLLIPTDPANNQVLFRRDQSDSDGTFMLGNVVPGTYTLLAIQDGWELEWAKPEVLQRFMAQGETVIVAAKGKYSVKVKVQQAGSP
jgi:hypothetical protein